MKKISLFVAAYFVITMAWAYAWHVIFFAERYASWGAITREEPLIMLGITTVIIQGIVIGYLYPFFYQGGQPIKQGVTFSLIIGLMIWTVMGFGTAAKFAIDPIATFLIYHTIFQLIQFVLTRAALGWIYKP